MYVCMYVTYPVCFLTLYNLITIIIPVVLMFFIDEQDQINTQCGFAVRKEKLVSIGNLINLELYAAHCGGAVCSLVAEPPNF